MPSQLDALYILKKEDVLKGAKVLADAFENDPVWKLVLDDANPTQRAGVFETPLHYCLKYGQAYATSENLEGVAAWMPGDLAEMTPLRLKRSGAIRAGMKMGWKITRRMEQIFSPLDAHRKETMKGKPFIYLQIIGVAPALQGRGFGGKILTALIQECDQTGTPLYLETETESNVRMYEHLGFEVIQKIILPVINLPMWEMVKTAGNDHLK